MIPQAQADAIAQRQRAQEKCVKVCTLADVLQVNCTSGCEFEMSGCIGRDASACETTFTTKYRMVAGVSQAATERQIKEILLACLFCTCISVQFVREKSIMLSMP